MISVKTLTKRRVAQIIAAQEAKLPRLIAYERASREAREQLRRAGISYAGQDGRLFLRAPGMYVEREDRLGASDPASLAFPAEDSPATRNPFATRASRVARWLLLHPDKRFSVSQIAHAVESSPPAVSRVLHALEDRALIDEQSSEPEVGRRRQITLTRPRRLLEAWAPTWERRRIRQRAWDIGAIDADEAMRILADAADRGARTSASDSPASWAIGGLAGAARWHRAAEPSDVLVWVDRERVAALADLLQPMPIRRPGVRGSLRVAITPDPWVLDLAAERGGIRVADPVQLWLDCATEGERAIEAADAVAKAMGW